MAVMLKTMGYAVACLRYSVGETLQSEACALRHCLFGITVLVDLRRIPGLRLEKLSGNRAGQHSIRINDKYRICFRWENDEPQDVEITDYH